MPPLETIVSYFLTSLVGIAALSVVAYVTFWSVRFTMRNTRDAVRRIEGKK